MSYVFLPAKNVLFVGHIVLKISQNHLKIGVVAEKKKLTGILEAGLSDNKMHLNTMEVLILTMSIFIVLEECFSGYSLST